MIPQNLARLLETARVDLPGEPIECEGAKHHSPRPMVTTSIPLVRGDWWGGGVPLGAPKAMLCGTCATNLDVLLRIMHAHDGSLSWLVRREFGNQIRALAESGWEWFLENGPAASRPVPQKG